MRLKSELYAREQRQLCDQVISILALDEKDSVWLADLDADKERQRRLLELIPEIRKYYSYTKITGADNPAASLRPWLSIARAVTKPYYHWQRTEYQKDKKRTSLYFLSPKNTGAFKPGN